jgi:hypothetical protein
MKIAKNHHNHAAQFPFVTLTIRDGNSGCLTVDNPFKVGELVTGPTSIKEPTFRKGDIIKQKFYYVSDINKNKIYLKDLKGEEVPGYFRPYQLRKVKPEDYVPILSQLEPAPNKTVGGSLLV